MTVILPLNVASPFESKVIPFDTEPICIEPGWTVILLFESLPTVNTSSTIEIKSTEPDFNFIELEPIET